jgi:hypothetical protein
LRRAPGLCDGFDSGLSESVSHGTQGKLIGAVRRLYEEPSAAAKDLGLTDAFFGSDEPFSVWEENVLPLGIYIRLSTQWRVVGTAVGIFYTGLDYSPFYLEMERQGLQGEDFDRCLDALRIIEGEAARILNSGMKNG